MTAFDGGEARRVFEERADELACVVLDLTMPGLPGEQTATGLRRIKRDAVVILSSGFIEQGLDSRYPRGLRAEAERGPAEAVSLIRAVRSHIWLPPYPKHTPLTPHMQTRFFASLTLGGLLVLGSPAASQCGGQGNLVMEMVSTNGALVGSHLTIRIIGRPLQHVCLMCSPSAGPNAIAGLGTFCLELTQLVEFAFQLPASGVIEFQATLPQVEALLCCQVVALEAGAPNGIATSNGICLEIGEDCDGGLVEFGHMTVLKDVTSFPVDVTSTVEGRAGGGGSASETVSYDPNNPPTFPVATGGNVFIENIARLGDDLYVTTLVRAGGTLLKAGNKIRLPNEITVQVSAGNVANSAEEIHTSCSQPIGVGIQFGAYTITAITSVNQ